MLRIHGEVRSDFDVVLTERSYALVSARRVGRAPGRVTQKWFCQALVALRAASVASPTL